MEITRRPLKTRSRRSMRRLAAWLAGHGVTPNTISICSLLFAAIASGQMIASRFAASPARTLLLLGSAAGIQMRLLCNLLDGMVAVEHGRRTLSGEIFNEVPDRFADVALLAALGYALPGYPAAAELGWAAALAAVLTAYIRAFGGALGLSQNFSGPMAKPHRMAVLTFACLLSSVEGFLHLQRGTILWVALWIILIGSAWTCVRRLLSISRELRLR